MIFLRELLTQLYVFPNPFPNYNRYEGWKLGKNILINKKGLTYIT